MEGHNSPQRQDIRNLLVNGCFVTEEVHLRRLAA